MNINTAQRIAFTAAEVDFKPENIVWDGVSRHLPSENHMKEFLAELQEHDAFKKAVSGASDQVKISSEVSNFSPGAFYLNIDNGHPEKYFEKIILSDPLRNIRPDNKASFMEKIAKIVVNAGEAVLKAHEILLKK